MRLSDRTERRQGIGPETQKSGVSADDQAVLLPEARFVRPMRKPADITAERKRLYRAAINGRVSVEEAARLSFILTSIRADLEADQPEISQTPQGPFVSEIHIHGVPPGTFLSQEEVDRLAAQHAPPLPEAPPSRPMLRLFENEDVDDVELPEPAA